MRLRQLATQQSIIVFCPFEVELKVRELCGKSSEQRITIQDVVKWTILQTRNQLETGLPLWRQQGINFVTRQRAWREFHDSTIDAETASDIFREPEAHSLEVLYGLPPELPSQAGPVTDPDHLAILERWQKFVMSTPAISGSLFEEQERELAHEKVRY
jgi:hypothetical protein